jgi:hypothetical protein
VDSDRNRNDSYGNASKYKYLEKANELHPDLKNLVKTEMSYMLYQGETGNVPVFIVGFAIDRIDYTPQKMNFFSGLGYAIYVAAFDLDAETDDVDDFASAVLDQIEFSPKLLRSRK